MGDQPDSTTDSRPFIKVYINELRALAKEHGLRRAEIGELLALALYMDDQGVCWPSAQTSADDIGLKSGSGARRIQRQLKQKGVITWDFQHDKASPRFHLPTTVFYFGSESYHRSNRTGGGLHNRTGGGLHNSPPGGLHNSAGEQEPSRTKTSGNEKHQNSTAEPGMNNASASDVGESRELERRLINAGVAEYEARLIVRQYRHSTVKSALSALANSHSAISNPGGWVRRTIERRAGQPLAYPNSTAEIIQKITDGTAVQQAEEAGDPYLDDAYFRRQNRAGD